MEQEKAKYIAAYIHAFELAKILSESEPQEDISETILQLAKWIKNKYHLSDDDIIKFSSIINEIKNGEDNADS